MTDTPKRLRKINALSQNKNRSGGLEATRDLK